MGTEEAVTIAGRRGGGAPGMRGDGEGSLIVVRRASSACCGACDRVSYGEVEPEAWQGEGGLGKSLSSGRDDPVDRSPKVDQVNLTGLVLAERGNVEAGGKERDGVPPALRRAGERPHRAGAVVPEEIHAEQRRQRLAAIYVAAGDRTSLPVVILPHRQGQPLAVAALIVVQAFHCEGLT